MGRGGMAAAVPEPAPRHQPGDIAGDAGVVLAIAPGRPGGRAVGHAARQAYTDADLERPRRNVWMPGADRHRQSFWSHRRSAAAGWILRAHLSIGGGTYRTPFPLLPSG